MQLIPAAENICFEQEMEQLLHGSGECTYNSNFSNSSSTRPLGSDCIKVKPEVKATDPTEGTR